MSVNKEKLKGEASS